MYGTVNEDVTNSERKKLIMQKLEGVKQNTEKISYMNDKFIKLDFDIKKLSDEIDHLKINNSCDKLETLELKNNEIKSLCNENNNVISESIEKINGDIENLENILMKTQQKLDELFLIVDDNKTEIYEIVEQYLSNTPRMNENINSLKEMMERDKEKTEHINNLKVSLSQIEEKLTKIEEKNVPKIRNFERAKK